MGTKKGNGKNKNRRVERGKKMEGGYYTEKEKKRKGI